MKTWVRSAVGRAGLDVRRRRHVPFGVRWEDDLRRLLGDRAGPVTLVDVGANVGQTAQSLAATFPDATVYSFEPVPSLYARLLENTAALPHVTCVNAALGDRAGEASMTADRDGQNTLLPGVASAGSTLVRVDTLDDFCREHGIERVQLLKIDTEGYEPAVLRGAAGLLDSGGIDFVLAECEFVHRPEEPHGDFFEIHDLLARRGFRVAGLYSGGVDERGWVWGDVLMVRQGVVPPMAVIASPYAH